MGQRRKREKRWNLESACKFTSDARLGLAREFLVEAGVGAASCDEFVMGAVFDDATVA